MDKKQLFNRNDPNVIKAAMNCDVVEDFVNLYKDSTSATDKTLTQAYYDIKYNSKISTIRMKSGATKNSEPISAVPPIKKHRGDNPKPVKEVIKVFEADEAEDGSEDKRYEVPAPPKEKAPKAESKLASNGVGKEEKATTQRLDGALSKVDRVAQLFQEGKEKKEIIEIMAKEGYSKIWPQEFINAKKKL